MTLIEKESKLFLLYKNNDYLSAIKFAEEILSIDAKNILALKVKAACLKLIGRFSEAFSIYDVLININSKNPEILYNYANLCREVGKTELAKVYYKEAIKYNSNFVLAYAALSAIYIDEKNFELAKKLCIQGISKKTDTFDLHYALAIAHYCENNLSECISELSLACEISNGNSKEANIAYKLVSKEFSLRAIKSKDLGCTVDRFKEKFPENYFKININFSENQHQAALNSDVMNLKNATDARYGDGKCSPDFQFFNSKNKYINEIENTISEAINECIGGETLILDSFCNIFTGRSGTDPHHHLKAFDKNFELGYRKFSLVWYFSIGNQKSSEPGVLKLLDPEINILPQSGDLIIIPSNRKHSSSYFGESKRVMIGVNFYSLPSY